MPDTDNRNIIDHFKYWEHDAITAYLDERRHDFAIGMWHINYDINIGSIVRSANAFNAKKMYYVGKRQWDRRGAVGTHHYIYLEHFKTWEETRADWDGPVVAIEDSEAAVNIFDFDWPQNPLIMVGQESTEGLPNEVLDDAAHTVYIPQYGSVRSLNVANAASIAMYSWAAQHGRPAS